MNLSWMETILLHQRIFRETRKSHSLRLQAVLTDHVKIGQVTGIEAVQICRNFGDRSMQVSSRQSGNKKSWVRISRGSEQHAGQFIPTETDHQNSQAVSSQQSVCCGRPRAQVTGGHSAFKTHRLWPSRRRLLATEFFVHVRPTWRTLSTERDMQKCFSFPIWWSRSWSLQTNWQWSTIWSCEQNNLARHIFLAFVCTHNSVARDIGSSSRCLARTSFHLSHASCAVVVCLILFDSPLCTIHRLSHLPFHSPDLHLHLPCGLVRVEQAQCALPRMRT